MSSPARLRTASYLLAMIFPLTVYAGETTTASAMLYAHGQTMLNGAAVPRSSALFAGDLVQTGLDSVANINATGSTVLVLNDSLIQYDGDALKLEHGGITISTFKSMSALAGEVKISPYKSVPTEFEIRDVDGRVRIAARKGDLTVSDHNGTITLAQGQETTREESSPPSGKRKGRSNGPVAGVAPGAVGAILNSPWAIGVAGGAALGVVTWVLVEGDDPASPTK